MDFKQHEELRARSLTDLENVSAYIYKHLKKIHCGIVAFKMP